jgi:hypothetical protein
MYARTCYGGKHYYVGYWEETYRLAPEITTKCTGELEIILCRALEMLKMGFECLQL